jgi:DnaJ-domain-containing protein 1
MGWLDFFFGAASRSAKKTFGGLRAEFEAGKAGRPSPTAPQRRAAQQRGPVQVPARPGPAWWVVLGLPQGASLAQVTAAYRDLIQKNHPDKVAHLSETIRRVAETETRRINAAYEEAQRMLKGR